MLRDTAWDTLKGVIPTGAKTAINALLGRQKPASYNDVSAKEAAGLVDIKTAKVLVVGANRGEDCKRFIDLGAPEVHGLDVVDDIGVDFPHARVTYHRQSIEAANLPSASYDLVYCFAIMEHVPDIAAGFQEMARLVKPGGVVFSIAAPLWYSPYGHHMGCFKGHPWVHVSMSRDEIVSYATENGIEGERGHTLEAVVDYMLNPEFFNMRHAKEYISAVEAMNNVRVVKNTLLLESKSLLQHPLAKRAISKGFTAEQLLAETHRLVAVGR